VVYDLENLEIQINALKDKFIMIYFGVHDGKIQDGEGEMTLVDLQNHLNEKIKNTFCDMYANTWKSK
jgi:hypothetical protein